MRVRVPTVDEDGTRIADVSRPGRSRVGFGVRARAIEGMGGDRLLHETAVDRVPALRGGGDERVERELVDVARLALAGVEDLAARVVGQQGRLDLGALQVEVEVVARVLEREGPQRVRVGDAGAQRFERRQPERVSDVLGAGEQDAEALLGVEVVRGEAPQRVEDGDGESLGVVDEDQRMRSVRLFVAREVLARGVEEVRARASACVGRARDSSSAGSR